MQFRKLIGRRSNRYGKVAAGVLAVAMLASACSGSGGDNGKDAVQVGAILPMTGAQAALGSAWNSGLQLALDVINKGGGVKIGGTMHKFAVTVVDSESTPAGAQRAVQKLLANGDKFWFGPPLSSSFKTAYGAIQGTNTQLVLTPSAASEAYLKEGSDLLFKTQASQGGGGIKMFADFLVKEYSPSTVAILQPQDPTGNLISTGLATALKEAKINVVYNNSIAPGTTDYLPFISAIQSAKPDLVIGPYIDTVMAPMMDQAVQVGYTQPVFANYGGSVAALGKNKDAIAKFAFQPITRALDNPNDPVVADLRKRWVAKFGKEPGSIDFFALSSYDPLIMLSQAMKAAGTIKDPSAVGAKLRGVTDWPQKVMPIKFDDKGLAHYTFQVGTLTNGTLKYQDLGMN